MQYRINGENNIWIMKPACSSRGRGIKLYNSLPEILKMCSSRTTPADFIIQKYIESPLVIHNRKFDLRIWALVTCANPLTIWIFNKPYVRFTASDFTLQDINDRFIHLSNHAVSAKNTDPLPSVPIEGNMWFHTQL